MLEYKSNYETLKSDFDNQITLQLDLQSQIQAQEKTILLQNTTNTRGLSYKRKPRQR
jgi:hypothetical protein